MRKRIRYRYLVPLMSLLPERILRWLDHHLPIDRQPLEFGWSFWTDASYAKTCRRERRNGMPEEFNVDTAFEVAPDAQPSSPGPTHTEQESE